MHNLFKKKTTSLIFKIVFVRKILMGKGKPNLNKHSFCFSQNKATLLFIFSLNQKS